MQNSQTSIRTEDEVIADVLATRYYIPGEKTPQEMFFRVAKAVGGDDQSQIMRYLQLMENGIFLPNSPSLVNAGRPDSIGTLSACFVIPITDSLKGIQKAANDMACVHKAFGGTGFSFGKIRPAGALIKSTGGKACGPVKVLQFLDANANMVGQGGKREGGNMGILPVDHPDVMDWITCKSRLNIKHFNLSVSVTNEFMDDLEFQIGKDYKMWPCKKHSMEIFEAICQNAWERGCPGMIFIDPINKGRPEGWPAIEATNPCGEQPLGEYESCNLGSLNLGKFVYPDGTFDYNGFSLAVRDSVRFLDSIIDINNYPTKDIEAATLETRNIGLGIMGWADCLIKMGIHYTSNEALELIDKIGEELSVSAWAASGDLSKEKDTYPAWDDTISLAPQRNYTKTTIAPTGTLSKIAKCSPGIEPVYAWDMEVFTEQGTYRYHYPFMEDVKHHGLEEDTALKIPIEWHIAHQARWQKWIDNAVSKTINLPAEATVEDVRSAFRSAYRLGCKGITIYRDRSKSEQVLSSDRPRNQQESKQHKFNCRPGRLYEVMSGCGKMFIWIDEQGGHQHEVFVVSSGGCVANNESTGRILSDEMQRGVSIDDITRPLKKVKCINAMRNPNSQGNSCSDIIGQVIDEDYKLYFDGSRGTQVVLEELRDRCPSCGAEMIMTGGCSTGTCPVCGWSGCS